jgi:spore maturation protein CgeB
VVFIVGVGAPSHWRYGMEVLETVAREIPTFKWWGYGLATLPADSALRSKYQGEAYGLDMYEILLQSKICLNRHGEVAEGYANNMRLFEASGAGALLLTEEAPNLSDFFTKEEAVGYSSPTDAVEKIRYLLDRWEYSKVIAMRGQARTLRDHTYSQRMKTVSETLETMLCPA